MSRRCSKCKKDLWDEDVEIYSYCGESYYLCDECSIKVMRFIEEEK